MTTAESTRLEWLRTGPAAGGAGGPSGKVRVALASGVVAGHAALLLALTTLAADVTGRGPAAEPPLLVTAFLLPAEATAPRPAPAAARPAPQSSPPDGPARPATQAPRRASAEPTPDRPTAPAAPPRPPVEWAPVIDMPAPEAPAAPPARGTPATEANAADATATDTADSSMTGPLARTMPASMRAGPHDATPALAFAPAARPPASSGPSRTPPDHEACGRATHPAALRERGIEGLVRLRVLVGADGRAREVQLGASSGWRLFDEAALAQARGCRFRPAREDGVAVDSWVEYPVRFALDTTALRRHSP